MADDWDDERVARWLRQAEGLERQLAPVSSVLFEAARLQPGEAVLDVGCGTGPTTWASARVVGRGGRVCGLDVAPAMLDAAARTRPHDADDIAPVDWVLADPARERTVPGAPYDVVLSRFGVMFFSDPTAAFATLADATHSGGRLAAAVWQRRDESELFAVGLHAAVAALRATGVTATAAGVGLDEFLAEDGTGPFSLHDPDAVTATLTAAGWTDVVVQPHRMALPFAGGADRSTAATAAVDFGPTRALLDGLGETAVRAAEAAIAEAFSHHLDAAGHVVLGGAVHVVTARRP